MKLYTYPITFNPIKIDLLLNHMQLEVDRVTVNLHLGEHLTENFRAINPNALLPVLIDDDFTLWESQAILQYIANKTHSSLWPQDAQSQALVLRAFNFSAGNWNKSIGRLVHQKVHLADWGYPSNQQLIEQLQDPCYKDLQALDQLLSQHLYVAAEQLSIADFSLAAHLFCPQQLELKLEQFPNVQRWLGDLQTLDAWKKTQQQRQFFLKQIHAYTS